MRLCDVCEEWHSPGWACAPKSAFWGTKKEQESGSSAAS